VAQAKTQTDIIFVDMHAEATAEKIALALYLDGRVSVVAGTHTHVQTADERILPQGTAFITDAGCCGPRNSVIGMDQQAVFRRLIQQLPSRFEVASGPASACGILVKVDTKTGKALTIERIHYEEAYVPEDDARPEPKNGKHAGTAQETKQPETEEAKP
jgi:2',3'-cyclic-nucleotide 2'-phosphodiesterase